MPQPDVRPASPVAQRNAPHYWQHVLVPLVQGLEKFFWNLAWFMLLLCIVFSFNPFLWTL